MHEHAELGLTCCHRGSAGREPYPLPGTQRQYPPDRTVDVRHSRIELHLDPEVTGIRGEVTHNVCALDSTQIIRLHASELTIDDVRLADGRPITWRHADPDLIITLAESVPVGTELTVVIAYQGTPRRGIYFIHPDEGYPDKRHEVWTQSQDQDGRRWFPCFDHPSEKFSTELIAHVPDGYTTLSNGALLERAAQDDGTVRWHWRQKLPHSAYLVTLAVGRFDEIELESVGGVPLTALVPEGRADDGRRAFGRTPEMMRLFAERFGVPYPYEKYAQVVVQDFIFGGMENTTATTMIDVCLYDERAALDMNMDALVAHELAHQWWGDLVTCREWTHAWLNEGFATWSEILWKEHHEGEDEAAYDRLLKLRRYVGEDSGSYRRPIVDRRYVEPIDLFDRHLYEKGGLVLHMLRQELGEEGFWRSIHTYSGENRGRTVVTEDLRKAIATATGRSLDGFLDQWVYHGGHPDLNVKSAYDDANKRLSVTIKQTQENHDESVEIFHLKVQVDVVDAEGTRTTHMLRMEDKEQVFLLPAASAPSHVEVDPHGHLLATLKIEQDDAAHRRTLASVGPLRARIRAVESLAKDASSANVAALAGALRGTFWALASEAARALGRLRHPAAREVLLAALEDAEHPKVRRGVVDGLAMYRHDAEVAQVLRTRLEAGDASIFVEASLARALGAVRAEGAVALLTSVLEDRDSWGEVIRVGAADGLAALGHEDGLAPLVKHTRYGVPARLRAASIRAVGRLGRRLPRREPVLEALSDILPEFDLRIVIAGITALGTLGDPRGLALLSGAPLRHPDGRVQRAARVTARAVTKALGSTQAVGQLADDVDGLRQELRKLRARVDEVAPPAPDA